MLGISAKPTTTAGVVFWLCVAIALVIFAPLATIWAVNTLFGLTIPWTFDTWCAVLILGAFFNRGK